MISMNSVPSAGDVRSVHSMIEFIVALSKDPAAFDAVMKPLNDGIAQSEIQRAEAEKATREQTERQAAAERAVAELAVAQEAASRDRKAAADKLEQAKGALRELDAQRDEVRGVQAESNKLFAEVKALKARGAQEVAARKEALDRREIELNEVAKKNEAEAMALEVLRAAYEQKMAALKAAVGA